MTAITPEVIFSMNHDKLEYFTKQQILGMIPKTRRIYIIRMQLRTSYDMSEISRRQNGFTNRPAVFFNYVFVVIAVLSK